MGKHVMCAAKVNGKLVMRAYTPISTNDELGVFRLLIKTYFKVHVLRFLLSCLLSSYRGLGLRLGLRLGSEWLLGVEWLLSVVSSGSNPDPNPNPTPDPNPNPGHRRCLDGNGVYCRRSSTRRAAR